MFFQNILNIQEYINIKFWGLQGEGYGHQITLIFGQPFVHVKTFQSHLTFFSRPTLPVIGMHKVGQENCFATSKVSAILAEFFSYGKWKIVLLTIIFLPFSAYMSKPV